MAVVARKRYAMNVDVNIEVMAADEEEARDAAYFWVEAAAMGLADAGGPVLVAQPTDVIWGPEEVEVDQNGEPV